MPAHGKQRGEQPQRSMLLHGRCTRELREQRAQHAQQAQQQILSVLCASGYGGRGLVNQGAQDRQYLLGSGIRAQGCYGYVPWKLLEKLHFDVQAACRLNLIRLCL